MKRMTWIGRDIAAEKEAIRRRNMWRNRWNPATLPRGPIIRPRVGYTTVPRTRGVYGSGEMKYFDSTLASVAIQEKSTDWTGTELDPTTLNTLFAPSEGAAINQRIGRKVNVHKIKIRGVIFHDVAADQADAIPNPLIRVILYKDCQTNATQTQGEEVMNNDGATITVLMSNFQNPANFGRFQVLKDRVYQSRTIVMGTDGASTNSIAAGDIPFKMNIRYKVPVQVHFNATNGGTVADIVDNSWHIIATKSGTGFASSMSYCCRVCFKE